MKNTFIIVMLMLMLILTNGCKESKVELQQNKKSIDSTIFDRIESSEKIKNNTTSIQKDIKGINNLDFKNILFRYAIKDTLIVYKNPDLESESQRKNCDFLAIIGKTNNNQWFEVVNSKSDYEYIEDEDFIYGYININSNKEILNTCYYSDILKYNSPDEILNFYEKQKYFEKNFSLEKYQINRIGPLLIISDGATSVEFFDSTFIQGYLYNLADTLNENLLLLSKSYYEGKDYEIIDFKHDLYLGTIYSKPVFSRDRTKFISCGSFYVYNDILKIYRLSDNNLLKEFEITIDKGMDSEFYINNDIKWLKKDEIIIQYTGIDPEIEIKLLYDSTKNTWAAFPDSLVYSDNF